MKKPRTDPREIRKSLDITRPSTPPEFPGPNATMRKPDFNRIMNLLCNVGQLLDGWHADGTCWSEWDESVRKEVTEVMQILEPFSIQWQSSSNEHQLRHALESIRNIYRNQQMSTLQAAAKMCEVADEALKSGVKELNPRARNALSESRRR